MSIRPAPGQAVRIHPSTDPNGNLSPLDGAVGVVEAVTVSGAVVKCEAANGGKGGSIRLAWTDIQPLASLNGHAATPVLGEGTYGDPGTNGHHQVPRPKKTVQAAKEQGFTGNMCVRCGSLNVKASGTCDVCLDCGESGGCS